MKFIIGKKLEMTQIWRGEEVIAVTKVSAGPCPVVQVKSKGKDGYIAIQLGYDTKKAKNMKKPQVGHLKKSGAANLKNLKEFRLDKYREANAPEIKTGDTINVGTFADGDTVDVIGNSKGKGFQGVVKKYHFHGHKKTHGNKDQERMPGSIGAKGPAHVFKGTRMAGRMGGVRVTEKNLEIVGVDEDNNLLLIKGQVPGPRNSLVMITGRGELKIKKAKESQAEAVQEDIPVVEMENKIVAEENIEQVVIDAEAKKTAESADKK